MHTVVGALRVGVAYRASPCKVPNRFFFSQTEPYVSFAHCSPHALAQKKRIEIGRFFLIQKEGSEFLWRIWSGLFFLKCSVVPGTDWRAGLPDRLCHRRVQLAELSDHWFSSVDSVSGIVSRCHSALFPRLSCSEFILIHSSRITNRQELTGLRKQP